MIVFFRFILLPRSIKVFDLTRPSQNKKSQTSIVDVYPVNAVCCHPCGDFVLAGTLLHRVIRMYDIHTLQCFSAYDNQHHHKSGGINGLTCSDDGKAFASAGQDCQVILWDAVSNSMVNSIKLAKAAYSVQFSRSGKYLLTSSADGIARLFDLRTGKQLQLYSSGCSSVESMFACMSCQERFVATGVCGGGGGDVQFFDAFTGSLLVKKSGLHVSGVRSGCASPIDSTFISGGDDTKIRFAELK